MALPPRDDSIPPAQGPADLTGAKLIELKQPLKPAPYFVPRGHPSYYGFRHGVIVVTLGPGGTASER